MSTASETANSSANERQLALRLGWLVAELVEYLSFYLATRSQKLAAKESPVVSAAATVDRPSAATGPPSLETTNPLPPRYKIGRSATRASDAGRQKTGFSDSKRLWFLGATIARLCDRLSVPPDELSETVLQQLVGFPREPSDEKWRELFHSVESLNRRLMVELAARDPMSAKAFEAGKTLARLAWALPTDHEIHLVSAREHHVDAYGLLKGLQASEMTALIRDLRELWDSLPGLFSAIAPGLSAWEIGGRLARSADRVGRMQSLWCRFSALPTVRRIAGTRILRWVKQRILPLRRVLTRLPLGRHCLNKPHDSLVLRQRPRLPGPRYVLIRLPVIRRMIDTRLLKWLKPRHPRPSNVKLTADEAKVIAANWRRQCTIWRRLVLESCSPDRFLRPSDGFGIGFLSGVVQFIVIILEGMLLAGLGLTIAFVAAPGIVGLAGVVYGDSKFELSKLGEALSLGPLIAAVGGITSNLRKLASASITARKWARSRLVANAIRKQVVCQWNSPVKM